jgi:cardiolipin synthase
MFYPVTHLACAAVGLGVYVFATHHGKQRRHPSAAIAWVMGMIAFPYATLPVFLLFGSRRFASPPGSQAWRRPTPVQPPIPAWASRLSAGVLLPPPRKNTGIVLIEAGRQALDALVEVIEGARVSLALCTFVFADDDVGRSVANALVASAKRGCRVRVLLDAFGALRTPHALRHLLTTSGIELRRYMPLIHDPRRGRGNLRNHRKLVIGDDCRMWSGGRNIAEEYFVDRPGRPAWIDLSFVVEGAVAGDAATIFEQDWQRAGRRPQAHPAMQDALGSGDPTDAGAVAQLIPSGPTQPYDTLYAFLLVAIYQARDRILAATPYFVPDEALLQALAIACRRGVAVSLLVPARSNHRLADWARERDLRELAQAGAQIRLTRQMLHAKLVVIDDAVALCGSANLDGRSLFLNQEAATAFYGPREVQDYACWYARTFGAAKEYVVEAPSLSREVAEGLVRSVAFQL